MGRKRKEIQYLSSRPGGKTGEVGTSYHDKGKLKRKSFSWHYSCGRTEQEAIDALKKFIEVRKMIDDQCASCNHNFGNFMGLSCSTCTDNSNYSPRSPLKDALDVIKTIPPPRKDRFPLIAEIVDKATPGRWYTNCASEIFVEIDGVETRIGHFQGCVADAEAVCHLINWYQGIPNTTDEVENELSE